MVFQKLICVFVCTILFIICNVNAFEIITTVGSEVHVGEDFSVGLYALNDQGNILANFSIVYKPLFCGTYDGGKIIPANVITNFTLSDFESYITKEYVDYPENATATVIKQTTLLPLGVNFTRTSETFSKATWKELNGFRMPLSPTGTKVSISFENLHNHPNYTSTASPNYFIHGVVEIIMIWRDDASLESPDVQPINFEKLVLEDQIDPNRIIHEDDLIELTQYKFFDTRFNASLLLVQNATINEGGEDLIVPLKNWAIIMGNDFYNYILDLILDPERLKFISLPVTIGLKPRTSQFVTWDPNLELIFLQQGPPPYEAPYSVQPTAGNLDNNNNNNSNVATIVAIVIAAVVVLSVVGVVVFCSFCKKKNNSWFNGC